MQAIFLILLSCLIIAPILVAWRKGDDILDRLDRGRRIRQRRKRRRRTASLPLKADIVDALLGAEESRNRAEDGISKTLSRFRALPVTGSDSRDTDVLLEQTGQLLLARESGFSGYLDIAWQQSETIEILSGEVDALREVAGIDPGALKSTGERPKRDASASDRLLENLNAATQKRADVDRRLCAVGAERPGSVRPSGFDATVQ